MYKEIRKVRSSMKRLTFYRPFPYLLVFAAATNLIPLTPAGTVKMSQLNDENQTCVTLTDQFQRILSLCFG